MGVNIADLEAKVTVDKSDFDRGMRDVDSTTEGTAKKGRSHFAAFGAAAALGGAGAVVLGGVVKDLFSDMSDGDKVAAQTAAVLKSTGGAANVTAAQIGDLATNMSLKTGQDDEAIQSGENMLLTFKNIRNEAGANNDVFNQSTSILADMSAAMGTDMSTQAIQLGKALNDPAKGMTALARVGVTFTDQQKEQIKTMEASGNMMGAQKVILGELSSEFGGSAAAAGNTFSGTISRLKMTLENTAEAGLTKVLPFITSVSNSFIGAIPSIQGFVGELGGRVGPVIDTVASTVKAAMPTVRSLIMTAFTVIRTDVVPIVTALGQLVAATFAAIVDVLNSHRPQIEAIMTGIGNIIKVAAAVFQTVLLPIIKIVFEDVLPVAIGIAIDVLATILNPIHAVGNAWTAIKTTITGAVNAIVADAVRLYNRFTGTIGDILSWVRGHWPVIAMVITGPFAPLVALATNAFGVRSALTGAFGDIVTSVRSHVGSVISTVATIPGRVVGALGDVSHLLFNAGSQIIGGLIDGLTSRLGEVEHLASSIAGKIASLKGPISYDRQLLVPHGRAIIEGLHQGMSDALDGTVFPLAAGVAPGVSRAVATSPPVSRAGGGITNVHILENVQTVIGSNLDEAAVQIRDAIHRLGGHNGTTGLAF